MDIHYTLEIEMHLWSLRHWFSVNQTQEDRKQEMISFG